MFAYDRKVKDCFRILTNLSSVRKYGKKTKKKPHSMNRALIAYGLACAVQDHGAKEIRRAIAEIWNTDHPERLTKLIGEASVLTSGLPYSNSIAFVDAAVEKHERISLSLIENGL